MIELYAVSGGDAEVIAKIGGGKLLERAPGTGFLDSADLKDESALLREFDGPYLLAVKTPAEATAKAWVPYEGPRGGEGWQNTNDGEVRYQEEPPGDLIDIRDALEAAMDMGMREEEAEKILRTSITDYIEGKDYEPAEGQTYEEFLATLSTDQQRRLLERQLGLMGYMMDPTADVALTHGGEVVKVDDYLNPGENPPEWAADLAKAFSLRGYPGPEVDPLGPLDQYDSMNDAVAAYGEWRRSDDPALEGMSGARTEQELRRDLISLGTQAMPEDASLDTKTDLLWAVYGDEKIYNQNTAVRLGLNTLAERTKDGRVFERMVASTQLVDDPDNDRAYANMNVSSAMDPAGKVVMNAEVDNYKVTATLHHEMMHQLAMVYGFNTVNTGLEAHKHDEWVETGMEYDFEKEGNTPDKKDYMFYEYTDYGDREEPSLEAYARVGEKLDEPTDEAINVGDRMVVWTDTSDREAYTEGVVTPNRFPYSGGVEGEEKRRALNAIEVGHTITLAEGTAEPGERTFVVESEPWGTSTRDGSKQYINFPDGNRLVSPEDIAIHHEAPKYKLSTITGEYSVPLTRENLENALMLEGADEMEWTTKTVETPWVGDFVKAEVGSESVVGQIVKESGGQVVLAYEEDGETKEKSLNKKSAYNLGFKQPSYSDSSTHEVATRPKEPLGYERALRETVYVDENDITWDTSYQYKEPAEQLETLGQGDLLLFDVDPDSVPAVRDPDNREVVTSPAEIRGRTVFGVQSAQKTTGQGDGDRWAIELKSSSKTAAENDHPPTTATWEVEVDTNGKPRESTFYVKRKEGYERVGDYVSADPVALSESPDIDPPDLSTPRSKVRNLLEEVNVAWYKMATSRQDHRYLWSDDTNSIGTSYSSTNAHETLAVSANQLNSMRFGEPWVLAREHPGLVSAYSELFEVQPEVQRYINKELPDSEPPVFGGVEPPSPRDVFEAGDAFVLNGYDMEVVEAGDTLKVKIDSTEPFEMSGVSESDGVYEFSTDQYETLVTPGHYGGPEKKYQEAFTLSDDPEEHLWTFRKFEDGQAHLMATTAEGKQLNREIDAVRAIKEYLAFMEKEDTMGVTYK